MAVRDFTGERGVSWRVWDVTAESIRPQVKAEDYLADRYRDGWIVFETVSGGEKRRLCPPPPDWARLPESELRALLARSEAVSTPAAVRAAVDSIFAPRSSQSAQGAAQSPEAEALLSATESASGASLTARAPARVERSFQYPGGSRWQVSECEHVGPSGRALKVLRFTTGERSIDVFHWSPDWALQDDDALVHMLREGAPRSGGHPAPGSPQRRYDDPRHA